MFELIKKDIKLSRGIFLIAALISAIAPHFFNYITKNELRDPQINQVAYMMVMVILGMMISSSIIEEEQKNKRAQSYLVGIGYRKREIISSKFLATVLSFIIFSFIYLSSSKLGGNFYKLNYLISFAAFLLISGLYLSVSLSIGIKYGRYLFALIIILNSIGPSLLAKSQNKELIIDLFKKIANSSDTAIFAGAILIYFIYIIICVKLFEKNKLQ